MADYRWVRENVTMPQDNEAIHGRMPGDLLAKLAGSGWEPVTAVPDPKHTDTVLVLMRKD